MDENKIFDMLEKIYIEVQDTKNETKKHTERLSGLESEGKKHTERLSGLESEMKKHTERLSGLESEVKKHTERLSGLESEMKKHTERLSGLESEVKKHTERLSGLESEVKKHTEKLSSLDTEVRKNSLKLESVEKNVEIMAEVQKSHMDQNEKQHIEILKPMVESIDIIKLAVKDISNDVQSLKYKFDKVEKVTMQNTYDVAYLKSVK